MYPENGLHLHIPKINLHIPKHKWILLQQWEKTAEDKGFFLQGFKNFVESKLVVSKSGLYYIALHLHFDKPTSGDHIINITSEANSHVSKTSNRNSIQGIHLNDIIQFNKDDTISVYVFSSSSLRLTQKSRFILQFVSHYEQSIGFVAQPSTCKTLKHNRKRQLTDWKLNFGIVNGFSSSTGTYIILMDGYYLVTFKFVLLDISGRVIVIISADEKELFRKKEQYKGYNKWKTVTHTGVHKFSSKSKITLSLVTNWENGFISDESSYSVLFLSTSDPNSNTTMIHELKDKIKYVGGKASKITDWDGTKNNFYQDGYHLKKTGYYFVILSVVIRHRSFDKIRVYFSIDDDNKFEESVVSGNSFSELSISGVFFLKEKESIYCYIEPGRDVELLPTSTLIVYELQFHTSSLFSISYVPSFQQISNSSVIPQKQSEFFSVGKETGIDFNVNQLIGVKYQLQIETAGVYYVVLNVFIEESIQDTNQINLMYKNGNMNGNWKTISSCYSKRYANCFLSFFVKLEKDDQLSITKHGDSNVILSKYSSFELCYIKPVKDILGFSQSLKTDIIPSTNKKKLSAVSDFPDNLGPFFHKDLVSQNEIIKIEKEGIYLVSCNVIVNIEKVKKNTLITLSIKKVKSSKKGIFQYTTNVEGKSTLNLPFFAAESLELNDDLQISVTIKDKAARWSIDRKSVISAVLFTENKNHFLLVDYSSFGTLPHGEIWNSKPTFLQDDNDFFGYYYDIKAEKTFTALISVSVHGQLHGYTLNPFVELSLLLKYKQVWPHLVSTTQDISSQDSVFLRVTGVVVLHPSDIIKVFVNVSKGLEFKPLRGTTISLLVLEDGVDHIPDWNYFLSKKVFSSEMQTPTNAGPTEESGLYMIYFTVSKMEGSFREKRSFFSQNETLEKKLSNKVDQIWKSDNLNQLTIHLYPFNKTLFNLTCLYCEFGFAMISALPKNSKLVIDNNDYAVSSSLKLLGQEKENTLQINREQDISICDSHQEVDVIRNWYLKGKLKENVFYRAENYEITYLTISIFTEQSHENGSVVLAVDGQPYGGMELAKTQYSMYGYHHELNARLFLRKDQTLQVMFMCANLTYAVEKNSKITIFKEDMLHQKVDQKFVTFEVQPQPKLIMTSYEFNYTCSTGEDDADVMYTWNKIDFFTGALHENISVAKHISLHGLPEESGHYYCTVYYDGLESQSDTATLHIQDDDECEMMLDVNSTIPSCHENANCTNTIGSYYCECWDGFRGDGYDCIDINECVENNTCGNNSICDNNLGSFVCTCETGYRGSSDGRNCTDINECMEFGADHCEDLMSSNHTMCKNSPGSYECTCTVGYIKKYGKCIDDNECESDPQDYPCHSHAGCYNTEGSFTCECDQGWNGNGTYCEDIDECEKGLFSCAENASCVNLPGSYRCICDRGYKGDGAEKCTSLGCFPPPFCTGQYVASWWSRTPYLERGEVADTAEGLFRDILMLMIIDICNNCSEIRFAPPLNSSMELEVRVEENNTDFACPLYGSKEQEKFRGFPFIPIVESPGVAFFVKEERRKDNPLLGSLAGSWPILVVTLLLASLSGVIIWFLDTVHNPKEFPHSFLAGSWEGFWWAFITMTTVGYGDKAPRSFFARVFGIVWILVGLVIISTFTATITTVLTATSLANEAKLYGTKVGALSNSEEFRLGVKRNADVRGYSTVPKIMEALHRGEIQGALLDTYIAGEFQDDLEDYKLQEILEHVFVYGVVLSRDAEELEHHFRSYLERKQSRIYNTISQVVKPLKENKASLASGGSSSSLFDADSDFFLRMLAGGGIVLSCLLVIGFLWECFYWRRKKRLKEKFKLKEVHSNGHTTSKINRWNTTDIIEYQRKAFKYEVSELKEQISKFSEVWVDRLDEIERTHEEQLTRVERWLAKSPMNASAQYESKSINGRMVALFGNYDNHDM